MKFRLSLALLLALLAHFTVSAQNKPAERFPEFITVSEPSEGLKRQRTNIFQKYYKMKSTDELRLLRTETDALGFRREKFQQLYKGVPVDGATVTAHAKEGRLDLLSGTYFGILDANVKPAISAERALAAATTHVGAKRYMWEDEKSAPAGYKKPAGELVLVVNPAGDLIPRLAYKFDIYAADTIYRADVYIDANTGRFIKENSRIHDANVPANGNSSCNGSVRFTADQFAGGFRLREVRNGVAIETFNLNNGTNYGAATDFVSASAAFTADPVGTTAHWSTEKTYDYFLQRHGRNSYDNAGAALRSYVHFSTNYVNAFWDGTRMTYGDGDGVTYFPLATLDICGHEVTHGVTEFSAGLVYQNEPGALNESFSDIFGEAIENYALGSNNWLMGDEIGAGCSGGAFRSMSNPNAFSDPDTYLGTNWHTGPGDFGGVHTNSGVQNKWFYILTQGESGTNDNGDAYCVNGIGITKAGQIAYRNLTVYLSAFSNYAAARTGAIQAARDLFGIGSDEEIATTNAWHAVGVGAAYPPSISCPANIPGVPNTPGLCSANVFYSAPIGKANCPTVVQLNGLPSGAAFPVGITTNTFRVTDASGITATCSFTVEVIDTEAPALACPANITVSCDLTPGSTGNPVVTDNCDPNPTVIYADGATVGDCAWLCTFDRTWTATDNALNVSTCVQTITKSALALIEQALSADVTGDGVTDTLVMGTSNSTLTIPPGRGTCIMQWLPSPSTTPSGLTFKKSVVGADCRPGTNPVDGSLKITNALLGEALKLNLFVRLKPSLGTKKLNTLNCNSAIKPIILQALKPNPDVNELLRVSNAALGNIALQPHLVELLEALVCINAPLDFCNL